jgi:predicted 3-demethylubiquinone-9 3-methyltransferase (glyoxalase superfamily)
MVDCETQAQIDELWAKLTAGGKESRCGWLEDRYGLSWQIVPTVLVRLLRDPDRAKAQAAMQAMLQMGKLDIERLQQARDRA